MKIAIDGRALEKQTSGLSRIVFNLLKNMAIIDDDNTYVILFADSVPNYDFLKNGKFTCQILPGPRLLRNWYTFATHCIIPLALYGSKIDLFYSPYYFGPLIIPAKKIIVSPWDISFSTHPNHYKLWLRIKLSVLSKISCKLADGLVTCSNYDKRVISNHYKIEKKKIAVLRLSVDDLFKSDVNEDSCKDFLTKNKLNSGYILSVGTIYNRRNIDKLIIAFNSISKLFPAVKLYIVGINFTNPRVDFAALLETKSSKSRVLMRERVTDEELKMLYHGALYTYCTSTLDGETIILKESLACGTPVITNNLLYETVNDICIKVENPESVASIAKSLVFALSNTSERDNLSREGKLYIGSITWKRSTQSFLKFCKLTVNGQA